MEETGDAHINYENDLKGIVPKLRELSKRTRIIWLHQNPMIESCSDKGAISRTASQEKIDNYNRVAHQILKCGLRSLHNQMSTRLRRYDFRFQRQRSRILGLDASDGRRIRPQLCFHRSPRFVKILCLQGLHPYRSRVIGSRNADPVQWPVQSLSF
jgi:hypothetical protein